ncbi:MAG: hypothetical protein AB7E80_05410 [Hyphomicrobiaceae bacterium]
MPNPTGTPEAACPSSSLKRVPVPALTIILAGLAGFAGVAATADRHLAGDIASALEGGRVETGTSTVAATTSTPRPPVAGSEAFWLGRAADGSAPLREIRPTTYSAAIAVGDRYAFGGDAERRILEVTGVRPLELPSGDGTAKPKLIVSLRDVAAEDGPAVEMILPVDAPIAGLTPLGRRHARDL